MKKDNFNWDQWLSAVNDMRQKSADVVPPGWITPEQFAAKALKARTDSHARKLLVDLFRAGKAERKKFKVAAGETELIRHIWHYRLLTK